MAGARWVRISYNSMCFDIRCIDMTSEIEENFKKKTGHLEESRDTGTFYQKRDCPGKNGTNGNPSLYTPLFNIVFRPSP